MKTTLLLAAFLCCTFALYAQTNNPKSSVLYLVSNTKTAGKIVFSDAAFKYTILPSEAIDAFDSKPMNTITALQLPTNHQGKGIPTAFKVAGFTMLATGVIISTAGLFMAMSKPTNNPPRYPNAPNNPPTQKKSNLPLIMGLGVGPALTFSSIPVFAFGKKVSATKQQKNAERQLYFK